MDGQLPFYGPEEVEPMYQQAQQQSTPARQTLSTTSYGDHQDYQVN